MLVWGCAHPSTCPPLIPCLAQVKSIYVGNLPESADEIKIKGIFSAYGKAGGRGEACAGAAVQCTVCGEVLQEHHRTASCVLLAAGGRL